MRIVSWHVRRVKAGKFVTVTLKRRRIKGKKWELGKKVREKEDKKNKTKGQSRETSLGVTLEKFSLTLNK